MKIYLVGGAVRDKLLGLPVKERDYVVVGGTVADMVRLGYRQVGKEFPVFLHPKTAEEYALARMELKIKPGYKGFVFDTTPHVSLEEDLIRRDLTINAMAEDIETHKLFDPYGGRNDIKQKVLRHVSPAFSEDPVRILRVGRFLARYASLGFSVAAETIDLMHKMVLKGEVNALVPERVWKELERALAEKNPEKFFDVLNECQALEILFPELNNRDYQHLLHAACKVSPKPTVRFAVVVHELNADDIKSLCKRYKLPNHYRDLALITAAYWKIAIKVEEMKADELMSLFSSIDIFRREQRFYDFVTVTKALADYYEVKFNPQKLIGAASAARAFDVRKLLNLNLNNSELVEKIRYYREAAISDYLRDYK